MPCPGRASYLLIVITLLVTEYIIGAAEGSIIASTTLMKNTKGKTLTTNNGNLDYLILATWGIDLGGKFNCTVAYYPEKNETNNTCPDKGLTWFSRPDQNLILQIDPVAVSHEGNYICAILASYGNFYHYYRLQVLVTPVVTLSEKNRTAVCKAVGKPAAQISWTPERACVTTEQKHWDNGIVKNQSTCQLEENVTTVSCSVFHLTGNTTKSIQLNQGISGESTSSLIIIVFVKFCLLLVVLIMVGFMYYQRKSACRE